jgi:hypothetical protein
VGNEPARVRLLAAALVVIVGCTTKLINLAVHDGATDKVSVAGADADADADADVDADVDADAGAGAPPTCVTESQGSSSSCKSAAIWKQYSSDDCAATGATLTDYSPYDDCGDGGTRYVKYTCCSPANADADAADAVASTDFDQAYDAGLVVVGGGHYVQFTCCVLGDNNQCSNDRLGGPDVCYDAPTWKLQASERCAALGLNLGDSGAYGSCVVDAGP